MYNFDTLKSEYPQYQEVLLYFKTNPCSSIQHDLDPHKQSPKRACFQVPCYYYHTQHDIRRPVLDEENNCLLYDMLLCPSLQGGFLCPEGIRCGFSHSQNEVNYHPLYYKTEPCTSCMYSSNPLLCPKYHSEEESRVGFLDNLMMMGNQENSGYGDSKQKLGQFNLDMFKVKPCIKKGNHNVKICDYYHHDKDRRRPTSIYSYAPPMCPYVTRNNVCPNADNCRYSHNKLEQLYHPERYKRKFCQFHPHNIHKCEYGDHCSFAHTEGEIMIEILHNTKQDEYFYMNKYKTVFCPYIYEHDRNQCIYAHNPQDLRRDPNQYKYNAVQCCYWSQGQIFCYEEGGCPNQMDCQNCHGWKELEYHPLYYKTKPCNNAKKCTKKDCPFYHSNADRRETKVTSQLTKSLLQNIPNKGFQKSAMFSPESSNKVFEHEGSNGVGMDKPMNTSYQQSNNTNNNNNNNFSPFRLSHSENSRKNDSMLNRFSGSSQATTMHASSVNGTEDELTSTYKQKNQGIDFQFGFQNSVNSNSGSPEKGRYDVARSLFSQPLDVWGSLHQAHEDKLDDIFATGGNSFKGIKGGFTGKMDNSFDSMESTEKDKNEALGEKNSGMSNEEFKKALTRNLEKKGLQHTKQYLVNPMIDLGGLKAFGQKDFGLFPHISSEEKEKIAKIIQDIVEEEALLSEVNTVNGGERQQSLFGDDDNLFKSIGLNQ